MIAKRRRRKARASTVTAAKAAAHGKQAAVSKAELREFRRLLLEKRRSIAGDLSGITAEARGSSVRELRAGPSVCPSPSSDLPNDLIGAETTLGLLAHERTLLCEIDEALERIENGTYGICLATGKPIGKVRLRAQPWAKYCIEYARRLEGRRRRVHHASPSWQERAPVRERPDEDEEELDELEGLEDLGAVEVPDPPPAP